MYLVCSADHCMTWFFFREPNKYPFPLHNLVNISVLKFSTHDCIVLLLLALVAHLPLRSPHWEDLLGPTILLLHCSAPLLTGVCVAPLLPLPPRSSVLVYHTAIRYRHFVGKLNENTPLTNKGKWGSSLSSLWKQWYTDQTLPFCHFKGVVHPQNDFLLLITYALDTSVL